MLGRRLVTLTIALLIFGCTAVVPSPETSAGTGLSVVPYTIVNVDGPTVDVVVNGVVVGQLACHDALELATAPGVPVLPWTVELRRLDGRSLGAWNVSATSEPRKLLMRGDIAGEVPSGASAGPAPRPCPS